MKLLLLNPPITRLERYGADIGNIAGSQMPLGISYLAAFLNKHGFTCDILDAEHENLSHQAVISGLGESAPDIIGITSATAAIQSAVKLARNIKEAYPEKKIIIGGPHISALPAETMKEKAFDVGVIGEGELTFLELAGAIAEGGGLDGIQGIVYKKGRDIRINQPRPRMENLDILPPPVRHEFKKKSYSPPLGSYRRIPVYNIITSRGCPYNCIFCDKSVFGSQYRAHSPEYVVSEIEELIGRYGAREIAVLDDDFTLDKNRLFGILGLLKKRRIRVEWSCMARPDPRNIDLLKYMREAGCWHLSIGIESADSKILDSLGKGTSREGVMSFIKAAKKAGFKIKGFLVLGNPGETKESIEETISFVRTIGIDDICATLTTPFPGSRLYREGKRYGNIAHEKWEKYTCWEAVFVPRGLSPDFIRESQHSLYKKFYTNPRIIFGHVANIKTLHSLKKYAYTLFKTIPFLRKTYVGIK